jgi:hypothetical protein
MPNLMHHRRGGSYTLEQMDAEAAGAAQAEKSSTNESYNGSLAAGSGAESGTAKSELRNSK